jgi:DNA-binding Xre family transcriptional regulator
MSSTRTPKVSYHWHLRMMMAAKGLFATSDLVPLLAERGVVLSREQVYRLVAKVPERLNLTTLAALCDILECGPDELIEPVRRQPTPKATIATRSVSRQIVPHPARITRPMR